MILPMREQGLIFLFICALGFAFGLLYDVFRILRRAFPRGRVLCLIEDFLYWVFASVFVFYILLGINFGEVRLYMVLGFMGGMTLYFLSLSGCVVKYSVAVLRLLKRAVLFLLKPFIKIWRYFKMLLKKPLICGIIVVKNMLFKIKERFKWQKKTKAKKSMKKMKKEKTKSR